MKIGKIFTRIISVILVAALLFSEQEFSVFAESIETEGYVENSILYSGIDGDLEWSIDENGVLRISGVGDYEDDGNEDDICDGENGQYEGDWREYSDYITSAVVNVSGITSTRRMFYRCWRLESIDVTNLDTKNVTNMKEMFGLCNVLSSINVNGFNTKNVTNMSCMFLHCGNLTNIDVTNFDTQNVTDMSDMFAGCGKLSSIDVTNFNTENVINMSEMFRDCNRLSNLDVRSFNTQNLRETSGMFWVTLVPWARHSTAAI